MSTDHYQKCPKCSHKPPQPLAASDTCPACGIYLFKWEQAQALKNHRRDRQLADLPLTMHAFVSSFLEPLATIRSLNFYGRCLALVGLALWSWPLFGYDHRTGEMGGSFMHNILLPIHESGHIFFRLFGEFIAVLGGSLFQLALPFGIGIAFIIKYRDNFGAALGLWWTGASLLDLSPYIYDALQPMLILLGGATGEAGHHDWIYLFKALGQLQNAQRWGTAAHWLGGVVLFASLVWAAAVLWRQREKVVE